MSCQAVLVRASTLKMTVLSFQNFLQLSLAAGSWAEDFRFSVLCYGFLNESVRGLEWEVQTSAKAGSQ